MLAFLRRAASSPIGAGIFGLVLLAFMVTLYEGKTGFDLPGIGGGGALASVGGESVTQAEAAKRAQAQLDDARQQQPGVDMTAFVAAGGVDKTVDRLIDEHAISAFAATQGLVPSRKLIDGMIAGVPLFHGPDGKFDRSAYLAALQQRKMTEDDVRTSFSRQSSAKMLLIPVAGAPFMPRGVAENYAALLLEARSGSVGLVPSQAFANSAPVSDAELSAFYAKNAAHYTLPERRIIKYALFDGTRFLKTAAPTEPEISGFYAANAKSYAASEKRSFSQVIVPSASAAADLAARVKGGLSLDAAAKSLGLAPLDVASIDQAGFAAQTSTAVAAAAFATPTGGIATVQKSGLGYHIVKTDSISGTPARSLAQAHDDIARQLSGQKADEAFAALIGQIEDSANDGASFDDMAKKFALTPGVTPPVAANGQNPQDPKYQPFAELQLILRDAYRADPADAPSVTTIGAGKSAALIHVDRILASGPQPLGEIRARVTADVQGDRAATAAKKVAESIAAKVDAGTPLAQALASAGVPLPGAKPMVAKRGDVLRGGEKTPPPLALMFSMNAHQAKMLELPGSQGWYVVALDSITPGKAADAAGLVDRTRAELAQSSGDDHVEEFISAIKAQLGVKRNDDAIADFKRALPGTPTRP